MSDWVVIGTIQDGTVVHGPFPDRLEALAWAQAREDRICKEFPEFTHSFQVRNLFPPHPN